MSDPLGLLDDSATQVQSPAAPSQPMSNATQATGGSDPLGYLSSSQDIKYAPITTTVPTSPSTEVNSKPAEMDWMQYARQVNASAKAAVSQVDPEQDYRNNPENVPEWGRNNPNLYGVAGAARETLGPVLEAGSMIAGGVMGTAGAGPMGGVAGAGLGYAGAKNLLESADVALGNKRDEGIIAQAQKVPGQIAEGASMEMGGQVIGKGIGAGASYLQGRLQKTAENLYGSATKMPLSKKWTQTLPGREVSDRTAAIQSGIKNEVMPTERGLAKVTQLESETRGIVDELLSNASSQGDVYRTSDVLKGLDNAYVAASKSSDPVGAQAVVDLAAKKFMNRPKTITPSEMNAIKRQIYKEVSDYTGEFKSVSDTSQKGLAHEAMVMLEKRYPEIRTLNKDDAALIKLKEGIERATGRLQNRDIIDLGTTVAGAASQNPIIGAAKYIIDNPYVKARLAITLSKAGTKQLGMPVAGGYASGAMMGRELYRNPPSLISEAQAADNSVVGQGKGIVGGRGAQIDAAINGPQNALSRPAIDRVPQESGPAPMTDKELASYDAQTQRMKSELENKKAKAVSNVKPLINIEPYNKVTKNKRGDIIDETLMYREIGKNGKPTGREWMTDPNDPLGIR